MVSKRKCIYTDEEASTTDKVLPKKEGDEVHNWTNNAPCSKEYKDKKKNSHPTELELQINRAFKMLELAKLDVIFWERELKKLQGKNKKYTKNTKKSKKIQKEIKITKKEKEIEKMDFDKVIEKRKRKIEW